MRPDAFLRLLAEETGETLWALDLERLGCQTRETALRTESGGGSGGIAVVPLQGVLTPNGVRFMGRQLTPGMSTFRTQLAEAVANPDVGAIILDVDTPGGTLKGTSETAAAVAAANQVKPVIAVVDSLGASAGYWIASQARQIWMTPSAEVGSIGVMAQHIDVSGQLDRIGVKSTMIRSKGAPFKNEANSFEPLSEEALAHLQGKADTAEDEMTGTIAKGRNLDQDKVRADFGMGRIMGPSQAMTARMADRTGAMAEAVASLRTQRGTLRRRFSAGAFL